MTIRSAYELTDYETKLGKALNAKTGQSPCPCCGNTNFYIMGSSSDPWFVICCRNCGLKLEFLVDLLVKDINEEGSDVD